MKIERMLCFCMALIFAIYLLLSHASALENQAYYHGRREEKKIALTFDDGPHPRYTKEILRILDKYGVKATFFVIGENVEIYKEAARLLFASENEIGNHTYSHPHMKAINAEELKEELEKTKTAVWGLGGRLSSLFRPPEGKLSAEEAALIAKEGYKTVLWSIDTLDWAHNTPSAICKTVISSLRGGDILLFHDFVVSPNTTITALEQLIPQLQKSGYQFVTVSELLNFEF